jgi:hypothetical protein
VRAHLHAAPGQVLDDFASERAGRAGDQDLHVDSPSVWRGTAVVRPPALMSIFCGFLHEKRQVDDENVT